MWFPLTPDACKHQRTCNSQSHRFLIYTQENLKFIHSVEEEREAGREGGERGPEGSAVWVCAVFLYSICVSFLLFMRILVQMGKRTYTFVYDIWLFSWWSGKFRQCFHICKSCTNYATSLLHFWPMRNEAAAVLWLMCLSHGYLIKNCRYDTLWCDTIPYHNIPYHCLPYHAQPWRTVPYRTVPYDVT